MSNRSDSPHAVAAPIVTHVTEVRISLAPDALPLDPARASTSGEPLRPAMVREAGARIAEHHARVAAMMELLDRHGFQFRAAKNAVHGTSAVVEAHEAKALLLAAGFHDREFQIVLEYTRGWGML